MNGNAAIRFEEDGETRAVVSAQATWYFTDFTKCADVVAAAELALAVLRPHLNLYRSESMTQSKRAGNAVFDRLLAVDTEQLTKREEWGYTFLSGASDMDLAPWGLRVNMQPTAMPRRSGHFRVSVPADWVRSNVEEFLSWTMRIASALPFRSGHGGFGVQYDEGDVIRTRDEQIRAWLKRYRGLDANSLSLVGDTLAKHVKGVDWLTWLDAGFVKKLGGKFALRKALPPSVLIHDVGDGAALQAGAQPSLGDVNRQETLTDYRAVSRVIKPIRVKSVDLMWFDEEESAAWLERFDN
jgi:hypothetical protein